MKQRKSADNCIPGSRIPWSDVRPIEQPEDPRAHEAIRLYIRQTARRCAEIAESAQGMRMHVEGALAVAAEIRRVFGLPAS